LRHAPTYFVLEKRACSLGNVRGLAYTARVPELPGGLRGCDFEQACRGTLTNTVRSSGKPVIIDGVATSVQVF
jgi:hypothetical protein